MKILINVFAAVCLLTAILFMFSTSIFRNEVNGVDGITRPEAIETPQGTNVWLRHYDNGKKYNIVTYVDGKPTGVQKMWDKYGNLVSCGVYSNGCRWTGTFYMDSAGDWFDTYTNGIRCTDLTIPDDSSDYIAWLYSMNGSYQLSRRLPERIKGYNRRARWARDLDWSSFPGFLNYQEGAEISEKHNNRVQATSLRSAPDA